VETIDASERLASLGHETRLTIFRLLVQAGPEGMSAGAIGEQVAVPAATLSFHLAHLSRVGLISGRQESRFIFYSADFAAMDELIAFLTSNCCQGKACLPRTAAASTLAKRRATATKSLDKTKTRP
jgi:ArsR family transcriptional regulator